MNLFLVVQLLCIKGGRSNNEEITLFLEDEICSNFMLIQPLIYKFHNIDFLELPKLFEYLIEMAVIVTSHFSVKFGQ